MLNAYARILCVDKYWLNCHSEQIKNWNVDRNEARRKSDGELDREGRGKRGKKKEREKVRELVSRARVC